MVKTYAELIGNYKKYGIKSPYDNKIDVEIGTGIWSSEGTGRQDRWCYKDEEGNWHSTIGQKPQPFLTDALHEKAKAAIDEFTRTVERELKDKYD